MKRFLTPCLTVLALAVMAARPGSAHELTLPPSGDNQHSEVSQRIGLVNVEITYNSPNVHAPDGTDRKGKIWGELVPYGLANLGFGTCGDQCPWRGGSNENTTFAVDHDVVVQGKPLPAGTYGLHFIPGKEEWTIVFSHNSTAWGSFFYDVKEDALRVTAKPVESAYREFLTYEFVDREPAKATVELEWENLALPWTIEVPNVNELYAEKIREELQNFQGFSWQNWERAANFCLTNKVNLAEGLTWAQAAVDGSFGGQANFTTLSTLAALQEANGQAAESAKTLELAINHPAASAFDIHNAGRQLLAAKKTALGIKVLETNGKRFPGVWPTEVSLGRASAAAGKKADALRHFKAAMATAPDDPAKKNLENLIAKVEKGEAID
ncbi:MAG TPA: DUF2911 domain-containing protein [Thermoanaerobaculia bacterium]|nr:DUF2911 domain-containing protein [Thermoanaerobaculia bacterium]